MKMPNNLSFSLSLNSIVDLQDNKYMELLNINNEAIETLKRQFEVSPLVVPIPNNVLAEVYRSIDTVIHIEVFMYI